MEILNIKELSEYLKVSASTIRRMISRNEIPFFKLSNQYFFNKEKINSWIDAKAESNMQREELWWKCILI